ncbi:thiamine pyrophosphate-binding protein, partial [Herbaspirillum sp. HC18]
LGAAAYQSSTPYGAHFLSESPSFAGTLARVQKVARDTLAPYDLLIALGGDPLRMSVYSEIDALPEGLGIVQIGLVGWEIAKNYGVEIALKADLKETLRALIPVLKEMGGASLASRAKQRLAELAPDNWTARRAALVEQIGKSAGRTPID